MRESHPAQQLRTSTRGSTLRWTMAGGRSLRAYELTLPRAPSFCVSTRTSELHLVLEGELWVELGPARQQHRVAPGEGCLIHRGTPHLIQEAAGSRFLVLDLDRPVGGLGVTPIAGGLFSPALDRALPHLWEAAVPQLGEELERQLGALLERAGGQAAALEPAHNTLKMISVKQFLERHFAEPFDLAAVAASFGLDRFYLVRAFKRNFGMPPLAYVGFLRMEHFLWSMLREGGRRELTDVSAEAGFGDYSTFCRRVRGYLGRPPSRLLARPAAAELAGG